MSSRARMRFLTAFVLVSALATGLVGQAAQPSPAVSASPAPAASASPTANNTEAGALASPSPAVASGSPLVGSWKIERAVFELFGNLKDVTAQDERFYALLRLDANGKGVVRYGAKTEETEIEYEIRNGQTLTVAFGSRLKPQVDLFNLLILSDGSLYLRSTRLAQVNGTVTYLFRKGN